MRALGLALLVALAAGMARAEPPAQSPRPPARPEIAAVAVTVAEVSAATGAAAAGFRSARAGAPFAMAALAGTGAQAEATRDATLAPRPSERISTSGMVVSPRPPARLTATLASRLAAPPPRRPAALERAPAQAVEAVMPTSGLAVLRSPRPAARPERGGPEAVQLVSAGAIAMQPDPRRIIGRRGAICGDPRLRGATLAPIAARVQGCGLADPVKITEVSGLRLSTAATVDCTTATALADWVDSSVKPTVGRLGGGVAGLEVFASYACRPRNNQAGAKISEHGRGHAIDIGAIVLKNGATIRVLDHWRDDRLGPLLKAMHSDACGTFGTVLGPAADRFHQNHLHLDTARYRSGSFCR